MQTRIPTLASVLLVLAASFHTPSPATAQSTHSPTMDHSAHSMSNQAPEPTEGGQSAFAAIQEIVNILMADPDTDWTNVAVEDLRQHLIDMDAVTLRAEVISKDVDGGAVFSVTSASGSVTGSIRAMAQAHAATMSGTNGIVMVSQEIDGGVDMRVTGPDPAIIRGLGFIGVMTLGSHHPAHHLALARGNSPHQH